MQRLVAMAGFTTAADLADRLRCVTWADGVADSRIIVAAVDFIMRLRLAAADPIIITAEDFVLRRLVRCMEASIMVW